MTNNNLRTMTILTVVVLFGVLILNLTFFIDSNKQGSSSTTTNSKNSPKPGATAVTYNDAITGQSANDAPNERPELTSQAPSVQVSAFDQLNSTFLTDEQIHDVLLALQHYLLAHFGDQRIQAGIKQGKVTTIDAQTVRFTLVVAYPYVAYTVTIEATSSLPGTVPTVTIQEES